MKFTKMHGAGNDFVVIDSSSNTRNWSKLAIEICDRHYGIGADGLLIFSPSMVANFKMRIFNADGSESTVCGNGMRCLVKHYIDNHKDRHDSEITVETSAGIRQVRIYWKGVGVTTIQANMGEPRTGRRDILAKTLYGKREVDIMSLMNRVISINGQELLLSLISIGNPHAVYFYEKPVKQFPLEDIGPKIEQDKLFPNKTNFEVARIINRQQVEARVWERGVGETLACGSGACAIAVAGNLLGYLDKKVNYNLPGGILTTEWDIESGIFLSGPVKRVFTGEW